MFKSASQTDRKVSASRVNAMVSRNVSLIGAVFHYLQLYHDIKIIFHTKFRRFVLFLYMKIYIFPLLLRKFHIKLNLHEQNY